MSKKVFFFSERDQERDILTLAALYDSYRQWKISQSDCENSSKKRFRQIVMVVRDNTNFEIT